MCQWACLVKYLLNNMRGKSQLVKSTSRRSVSMLVTRVSHRFCVSCVDTLSYL
uniref:Uncharacterized protein n=1 Tax=Anguilla anguilla TaxID=7936 RepID=A0A0E9WGM5_ANGAN